jgi:transcriptional regulator with XRE-family HTH domain
METQQPTKAPDRFIRLLKGTMTQRGLSLRQFAEKADVSPAYLSRLFNRERGLPADEIITKFEVVLDIPRGELFDAAGRHDREAAKFFKKNRARLLMRTLAPLTDNELAEVQKIAQSFANRHKTGVK